QDFRLVFTQLLHRDAVNGVSKTERFTLEPRRNLSVKSGRLVDPALDKNPRPFVEKALPASVNPVRWVDKLICRERAVPLEFICREFLELEEPVTGVLPGGLLKT